mmetsp:Transcript_37554/g.69907  ORF Transcript_37554/g.69907 Transcript_37554/m.69907 type:complete len:373 (-) Transcript_37554:154-1272(-)
MAEVNNNEPLYTSLRDYQLLGRSGLSVSPLCYGCMHIAQKDMADDETSANLINSYIEQGGNFFDTANIYEDGKSEELLGRILGDKRSRVVLATKYTGTPSKLKGDPNAGGNSRISLVQSLDASLKRLNTGHIDLMYVHSWSFRTPVEEVMRSLDDAVRSGKVRYIAVSDTPAWKVAQANMLAMLRGWTPFIAMQTQYSLAERTAERDIVPMCREMGLGMCHWGPLAQGLLTGKYNHFTVDAASDLMNSTPLQRAKSRAEQRDAARGVDTFRPKAVLENWNEKNRNIALEVGAIAAELGRSSTQVAFNWLLQKPGTTSPIFAVRTKAQLDDVIGSLAFKMTSMQMRRLDDVSKIEMGFPQRWGIVGPDPFSRL